MIRLHAGGSIPLRVRKFLTVMVSAVPALLAISYFLMVNKEPKNVGHGKQVKILKKNISFR
jgi:hypothetical protein